MKTDCIPKQVEFEGVGSRRLVATFDAEHITSDGGLPLLHKVDRRFKLLEKFASCFMDHRDPALIHHTVAELVRQRVFGIACGYEDLSDHAALRNDPLLAAIVGKADPSEPLASPSTLNRLELTPADASAKDRYRKVVYNEAAIQDFFVDAYLDAQAKAPKQIILDLDATDDLIHGTQEGRFFHGYYGNYCYLPRYIFAGDFLLCSKLRKADIDASAGSLDEVKRIAKRSHARWPATRLVLRADSGFARDAIMTWCEQNGVDYIFGLARNDRLVAMIASDIALVEAVSKDERNVEPVRAYRGLRYRTLDSWSCERRVVAKAEWLGDKQNPRFVVSSFSIEKFEAQALYEELYSARGDMENRSRSSSSTSLPTGRAPTRCAPISCGSGSPRSRTRS